jgi:hypothetical protein
MAKKYYGIGVDGLIIRANSKEEAEKIVANKFTESQLEFGSVYYDDSEYDSGDLEEIRHMGCLHYPECINDPEIPCVPR